MTSAGADEIRYDPQQIAEDRTIRILDIRSPEEIAAFGFLPGSRFAAEAAIEQRAAPLDRWYARDTPIAVVCQSGRRARAPSATIRRAGFSRAGVLAGGILAWRAKGLPTCGVEEPDPGDVPALADPARFPRVLAACFVASTAQNALDDPMWEGKDPASIVRDVVTEEAAAAPVDAEPLSLAVHRLAEIARARGFPLEDIRVNTDRMLAALRKIHGGAA